jgi:hypothetical protein
MSAKKFRAKLGGQQFVKLKTNFFLSYAKASLGAYRPNRILLYNHIYFNDLCIYIIGVY